MMFTDMRKIIHEAALLLGMLVLLPGAALLAQAPAKSRFLTLPRQATVVVREVQEDYHPLMVRLEAPFPGGDPERVWLAEQKQVLNARRQPVAESAMKTDSTAPSPWLGDNFASNFVTSGVPNDNDMAISNGGKIVSVVNSTLYMHDEYGAILAGNISLDAWSAALGLNGDKFDPRALYDPIHDRFVVACLNGFTSSTSWVIVGFSQTNDPTGAWNLYALPGDPNADTLWTDYPIMALTHDELFLTGNLLYNGQSWQNGFNQSICWQIDLDNAYSGDSLQTRLWYNVQFGGRQVRNLCPIQGGSGPAGPNLYLLSNRNLSTGNDTVFIMEITDTINSPSVQFLVDYEITDQAYALPPNAMQQFNQDLATNDARWLDGFLENGNIQFVGNCLDTATGRAGFYHGTITDITGSRAVTGKVIGYPNGDYGYPAIAWMGVNPTDNDALLAINYCGPTAAFRAGCGAIYSDGNGGYSPLVVAKGGESYINVLTGTERWGDYTGVQRRYNESGVVWLAATYGKSNRQPGTWVAEYHHPSIVSVDPVPRPAIDAVAYPNPVIDMVNVEFTLEQDELVDIALYDGSGRLVKLLRHDRVRSGLTRFQFATNPLPVGVYFLRISSQDRVIANEKIVRVQ